MRKLTFGSLFTGIGGLDLGLERAGMKCCWQVEIDDWCRKVLAKHWPRVRRYSDIRTIAKPKAVDLICGGFPCQPFSQAGKRKGKQDDRWLWPEFRRIIREVAPTWVLVENVPGLLSCSKGAIFGEILRDLAACGYDTEWDCIPAAAFGAPHLRYRVFVIGHANGSSKCPKSPIQSTGKTTKSCRTGRTLPNPRLLANPARHRQRDVSMGNKVESETVQVFPDVGKCGLYFRKQSWWETEPDVGRVVDGVPRRVDRLRGLGNAVVPQVAEWVGRQIINAARRETRAAA